MERWLVLLAAGAVLVVLGVAIPYATFNREVSAEYGIEILAPADVHWILWLPMPLSPMDVLTRGGNVSLQVINPSRGLFFNATGSGNATLSETSHRFVLDLDPFEWQAERVSLSGSETGGGFWVYRATDHPLATLQVTGGAHWSASFLGGSMACGGPAFQGQPAEGWSLLADGLGDCVQLLDGLPWLSIGGAAGTTGIAVLVVAGVVQHRARRRREQVFLPPPA